MMQLQRMDHWQNNAFLPLLAFFKAGSKFNQLMIRYWNTKKVFAD
jgi:hypothetical protein